MRLIWAIVERYRRSMFPMGTPIEKPWRTWLVWLFCITCLAFLSKIAWYDIRSIYAQKGEDFDLGFSLILWAAALSPSLLLCLPAMIRSMFTHWIIPLYFLLVLHTVLTGFSFQNSQVHIFQECFKYLLVPMGLVTAKRLPANIDSLNALLFVVVGGVAFVILRLLVFLFLASSRTNYFWGTSQELLIYSALFSALLVNGKTMSLIRGNALIAIGSLLSIVGQKRTLLLCFAIAYALTLLKMFRKSLFPRLIPLALISLLLAALVLVSSNSELFLKLNNMGSDYETIGVDQRGVEVMLVVEEFQHQPEKLIGGFGGGATLRLPNISERKNLIEIHSLHCTPAAMMYRHGFLGGIVFVCTFVVAMATTFSVRTDRAESRYLRSVAQLFFVVTFVSSFLIFGLVDDLTLGVVIGLCHRDQRISNE